MDRVSIFQGECLEVMQRLADDGVQVDSAVTDPPYHLTSIVQRFGSENSAPATHGTDGAFARASRGFMGKKWDGGDIAFRPETWVRVFNLLRPGGHLLAFSATRTYHRMAVAIEDAGFEIRDQIGWLYGSGFPKSHSVAWDLEKTLCQRREYAPKKFAYYYVSDDTLMRRVPPFRHPMADEFYGWGTALKPSWEPICVARKPMIGTTAENVCAHGTGAININASLIGVEGGGSTGRWPANVIHDGSPEVQAAFAAFGKSKSQVNVAASSPYVANGKNKVFNAGMGGGFHAGHGDAGTPARFFYSAKADAADRLGSLHPTVKPTDLIAYLCRAFTPPGGTVLDCFAGSGSTGMACLREGFKSILIEREADSVADIRRRVAHVRGEDTPLFSIAANNAPPLSQAMGQQ